jgi:hypothetical protein
VGTSETERPTPHEPDEGAELGAEPGADAHTPDDGVSPPEPEPGAEPDAGDEPGGEPTPGDELEPGAEPDADEPAGDEPPPDDDEQPAEPAEPSAAAAAGMSEREFEKAARAFERDVERYIAKVEAFAELTGQPLLRNEMDLDFVPGYIFHPQAVPLTDEQVQFARTVMGEPIEPPFEQDPEAGECEACGGWGRVKTGSKVAGQNVVTCRRCSGRGYVSSRPSNELEPAPAAALNGDTGSVLTDAELSDADAWGTPRSHPDWGKSPQYRSPNWQAELEAYKAGQPAPVV